MAKIAWITDSTCGLSETYIKDNNIFVIPLSVIVAGESYKIDVDVTKDEFYHKLKDNYDYGIAIHDRSDLTGTYDSSINASRQTDFPVEVIDSKMGAYALGKMIRLGIEHEKIGMSYEEIVRTVRTYPDRAEMFLLPANMDQLRKSGRVSTPQAIFASLLNINLLLTFDTEGKVVVADKIRTKVR